MSFVSVIAREDFITVVSDGQVSRGNMVVQSDYKKFTKISDKQFIAFTGTKEFCEGLVNEIEFNRNGLHNLYNIVENLDKNIRTIPCQSYVVMFAVGGVGESGNIEFHTINNNPSESIRSFSPKGDGLSYAFLHNGDLSSKINLQSKLIEYIGRIGFNTPNKCIRAQKLLNSDVAKIDDTVNNVTFDLTIKK